MGTVRLLNDRQSQHALPIGYQLHWFQIETILGLGGFGITYLARDGNLKRSVAIKEYLPSDLSVRRDDSTVEPVSENESATFRWGLDRFISEARTLARFQHANIVGVHNVFEANNTAYMVMEYEQGRSLGAFLREPENCREERLRALLTPLLDGLEQVHEAGFVHRDIKPNNLFVREDGSPVLLDFGSARQALGVETRTLTSLVTPGYAPFEQYNANRDGDKQGPWTDIYALGATLYRAVTGKGPVDALTRAGAILKGHKDVLVPATMAGEGRYSRAFLRAIDRALAFQPEARPQSIAEWRDMFDETVDEAATAVDFSLEDKTLVLRSGGPGGDAGGDVPHQKTVRLGGSPAAQRAGGEGHAGVAPPPGQAYPPGDGSIDPGAATRRRPDASRRRRLMGILVAGIAILAAALWWYRQQSLRPVLADVQAVLDGVSCAALVAAASERSVTVSGYATQSVELAGAEQAVAGLPGVGSVSMQVTAVERSYCRMLEFYAPYWRSNQIQRLGTAISTPKPGNAFVEGESLVLDVAAPLYRSYLYVDYHFRDGYVVHLLPAEGSGPVRLDAGEWMSLGEGGEWIVSAPFGKEMIAVIAAPFPLFADIRQGHESDGDYLAALNERLKGNSAGTEGRPVTADFVFITTKPRGQ
jgi:serine/threonine protein kinase